MGCISQLRRGTRYRLGAWALIRPPTVEAWHEACLPPFSRKREAQLRDGHHRALKAFLRTVAHEHPQLIGLIFADKGVAALRLADLLTWLLGRDEAWLRREFPSGEVCLGYHVPGAVHTCLVPGLDPLAPSHAAGGLETTGRPRRPVGLRCDILCGQP
jgi:hypothetical protein